MKHACLIRYPNGKRKYFFTFHSALVIVFLPSCCGIAPATYAGDHTCFLQQFPGGPSSVQVMELEQGLIEVSDEINSTNVKKLALQNQIQQFQEQAIPLQQNLTGLREEKKHLEASNQKIMDEQKPTRDEVERTQVSLGQLQNEIGALDAELGKQGEIDKKFQLSVQPMRDNLKSLEGEKERFGAALQKVMESNAKLEHTDSSESAITKKMQAQLDEETKFTNELKNTLERLKGENTPLQAQVDDWNAKKEKMLESLNVVYYAHQGLVKILDAVRNVLGNTNI